MSLRTRPAEEGAGFLGAAHTTDDMEGQANNSAERGASSDQSVREDEFDGEITHFLLLVAGVFFCWCGCNGK